MRNTPLSALALFQVGREFFFIIRQNHLNFFPGYCSFPGGKVDAQEQELNYGDIDPRLLGGIARELKEELDFDLREALEREEVCDAQLLGSALTPDFYPYRFDARYLLIQTKEKPNFEIDRGEIKDCFWAAPEELQERFQRGELIMIPPMWKALEAANCESKRGASFEKTFPDDQVPCLESIYGVKQFMPLSDTLPPATRTNAFAVDDLLVDPSPKNEEEYEKLCAGIAAELGSLDAIKKILITHHHPDHRNLAPRLARKLGAVLLMSSYTRQRLLEEDPLFFEGTTVELVKEGDEAGRWLGEKVVVFETPGHDEGQICIAPESLRWFVAGDLFQGVGTVVIGAREGSMSKYFATLERIISLSPQAVYPSHGVVLGGTRILEKTLEHRKAREAQVKSLFASGLSREEMLDQIYAGLSDELRPYALANIESHLLKLREEGAL